MIEHWFQKGWRPLIGYSFAGYLASMWILPIFGKTPAVMSADLTLAVGGVLGVTAWFRGRAQVEQVTKG